MPSLLKVKSLAQIVICATNLKSYGTALHMYAADNDDKAPWYSSWLYSQETIDAGESSRICSRRCRWHYDGDKPDGSLWPYLESEDVHMCPTFRKLSRNAQCQSSSHSDSTPYNPSYSYTINVFIAGIDGQNPSAARTMKLSKVDRSSECFAFSEENTWTIAAGEREPDETAIYSTSILNDNGLWMNPDSASRNWAVDNFATYYNVNSSKRNEGYANVVFVDGRVSKVKGRSGYEAYSTYGKPYRGHKAP